MLPRLCRIGRRILGHPYSGAGVIGGMAVGLFTGGAEYMRRSCGFHDGPFSHIVRWLIAIGFAVPATPRRLPRDHDGAMGPVRCLRRSGGTSSASLPHPLPALLRSPDLRWWVRATIITSTMPGCFVRGQAGCKEQYYCRSNRSHLLPQRRQRDLRLHALAGSESLADASVA